MIIENTKLKKMEITQGIFGTLIGKAADYLITTLELTKLKLTKAITTAISVVAFKIVLLILISILFNVFSIGAGLWLGELLGKTYYGFFAVSVWYLVLILVLHLFFQKRIKRIIINSILKHKS